MHGSPLIDRSVLDELLEDGGLEHGIVTIFVTTTHSRLRELAEAADRGDAERIARVAHSLKGACATFGALRLATAASRLSGPTGGDLVLRARTLHGPLAEMLAATELPSPAQPLTSPTAEHPGPPLR